MICCLLHLISFAVLTYLWPPSILKVKSSPAPTCYLSNAGIPPDSIDPNSSDLLDHVAHGLVPRKLQGSPAVHLKSINSNLFPHRCPLPLAGPQDPVPGGCPLPCPQQLPGTVPSLWYNHSSHQFQLQLLVWRLRWPCDHKSCSPRVLVPWFKAGHP